MFKKIQQFTSDVQFEMNKVSWMTRSQVVNSTFIVGVFSFIIAIFLFILDLGLSEFINVLFIKLRMMILFKFYPLQ